MHDDLDRALVRDFPLLFVDRHADMRKTAMCWGFPGDGWEPIIRRLAEKIEPLLRDYAETHPPDEIPRAIQVKEKFGTLRFYMDGMPEEMSRRVNAWIDEAEAESERTCELCGAPGTLDEELYWTLTLCPRHQAERYKVPQEETP